MAPPKVKIKHLTRSPSGNTRFPKLDECAHFHYEAVELGPITVELCENQHDSSKLTASVSGNKENEIDCLCFLVVIFSNNRKWVVRRSYKNFVFLDNQLHRCVYDRKYSLLPELPLVAPADLEDNNADESIRAVLFKYLERFSQLAGSLISCGPVLNWLELDNRGNRLIVTDEVAINTPAVAAAYVVAHYTAQAADEISFDVGDMISVIDMPPPDESTWWRGKKGYEVGFFPSECVEIISDKVPHGFKVSSRVSTKPVFRKHGKLIAFFRSFLLSRPSRRKLKQRGILKERVFGCDLGEHLLNTGREIPLVLKCCTEFIEEHGVVDGIYRLSGVSSNIQRLRLAFDEDCTTNLGDPSIVQDVHSVASLLKMYFRELPNPLLTYQLYDKFVSAVQSDEDMRLQKIRDVVQQLPPPHYRTLQFLLDHLARIASHGCHTGMTPKNIAIVWAPNLLRSREVENGGVGALHVVGVQAVLTEYLIRYSDLIFGEKVPASHSMFNEEGVPLRARPKSLAISTPTKLLSLEEARARAISAHLPLTQQKYIEVGGGPDKLPSKYHTVIELPTGKQGTKLKKSPSGWKSFFSRGWYSGSARDKSRFPRTSRKASTGSLPHTSLQMQEKEASNVIGTAFNNPKKLRTVKSAESLAHCLKEGIHNSHEDQDSGSERGSHHASIDSSYSFEMSYPILPRSPSLHKHTRSSSHESYFENSIEMTSDSQLEDDNSLYYFVKEQMQRMQRESEAFGWSFENPKCLAENVSSFDSIEDSVQDVEKVVRKQKLSPNDNDFAHAKIQRLSWGGDDNRINQGSPFKSEVSELTPIEKGFPNLNATAIVFESNFEAEESNLVICNSYSWLKHQNHLPLTCHESRLEDSVHEADANKQNLCNLPSDNETIPKTVIERYGNAETVLVEVHATQGSSSESETDTSDHSKVNVGGEYCCNHEIEKIIEDRSQIKDIGISCDESMSYDDDKLLQTVDPVESHVDVKVKYLESNQTLEVSSLTGLETQENIDLGNIALQQVCENDTDLISTNSNGISGCDATSKTRDVVDNTVVNVLSMNCPTTGFANVASNEFCRLAISSDHALPENESKISVLATENSGTQGFCICETTEEEHCIFHELQSVTESNCSKVGVSDDEKGHVTLGDQVDSPNSVCIGKPLSTVNDPKPHLQNIQSLRTKIENLPLPKKRHVLNIPSPSSPVDEVRKKFELRATNQKQNSVIDCSRSEGKTASRSSDIAPKISRKMSETLESSTVDVPQYVKRKSDGAVLCSKTESLLNKRHSEPLTEAASLCEIGKVKKAVTHDFSSTQSQIMTENKIPFGSFQKTNRSSQPSLFTQLKIRKLQSLQSESLSSPTEVVDPWSDPILDVQDDYHPVISFPETTNVTETLPDLHKNTADSNESEILPLHSSEDLSVCKKIDKSKSDTVILMETDGSLSQYLNTPKFTQRQNISECVLEESVTKSKHSSEPTSQVTTMSTSEMTPEIEKCKSAGKVMDVCEDEAVRRERINRIKEERRAQLREKLKSESFRLESEEKEKIQSKFRLRKEHTRQTVSGVMFEPLENVPNETKDMKPKNSKDVKGASNNKPDSNSLCCDDEIVKSQKFLSSKYSLSFDGSPELHLETQTYSESDSLKESVLLEPTSRSSAGYPSDMPHKRDCISPVQKPVKGAAGTSETSNNGKWLSALPTSRSRSTVREVGITSSTDIRDRVAMFERSKDSKELCRSNPNGKFPPKQSASNLTPSFVR